MESIKVSASTVTSLAEFLDGIIIAGSPQEKRLAIYVRGRLAGVIESARSACSLKPEQVVV